MTKIIITGGAGFIGSHIAEEALKQNHKVVVVDDLSNGKVENIPKNTKLYVMSILTDGFRRMIESEKPDVIFHEAAQPSLRRSIEEPDYDAEVNIVGTIKVIMAAKAIGAHVVFASTSAVYPPDAVVPFLESDLHNPNLPYGIAKHAAELYLKNLGVSHTTLRYGNVYGPRQEPIGENQLIPHCIRYLRGEEPDFCINGDGNQMRDFIYVKDIARANLAIGAMKMQGVYNIGTGAGTSVNTICELLAQIAGKPAEFPHRDAKPGEARTSILIISVAKQTGWWPRIKLEDGLRLTWESYGEAK